MPILLRSWRSDDWPVTDGLEPRWSIRRSPGRM